MSTITFKALIDSVHFDPKKGTLKIQLIAASHVSIDRLTTLGPGDENVNVTLQSAQTKITDVGDSITLTPEAVDALEKAAGTLREDEVEEGEEGEGEIITEFPISEAEGDIDEVEEGIKDGLI
jgi:hypothetical protein